MKTRSARNNLLAGLFVIASVLLGVWVAFLLADRGPGMDALRFTLRFDLASGAPGLQAGSPVHVGGQQAGQVVSVAFDNSGEDGQPTGVDVRVEVRDDVLLFEDATIMLERPLLGSLSSVNISDAGRGPRNAELAGAHQGASPRIENGEVVRASAAPSLLAQAGLGTEQIENVKSILRSLDSALVRIDGLVERQGPEVEVAIRDTRTLIAEARTSFEEWETRVDTVLVNAEQASQQFGPLLARAQEGVDAATKFFTDADAVVADNRMRIEEILASLQSASKRFDGESVELLNAALRDARGAMAQAGQALEDVRTLLSDERPNIRKTLANLRLTSDQLKLTAIEVRSQPWRLLHEPTNKELEVQVLYDATRNYAQAASDVRAASEALTEFSLRRPSAPPGAGGGVGASAAAASMGATGDETSPMLAQRVQELATKLAESMQSFRKAEERLLKTLVDEEGK
jgi:ABC-type transporter Mla subunit MlaD